MMAEPHEYIEWPPAIKLFYRFLSVINYLDNPEEIIHIFDSAEPLFVEILRDRYS